MQAEDRHRMAALLLALHEMGHYVVARALGFRTGGVRIEVTPEGGYGISATLPETLCSMSDVKAYLERRALVLFAGVIAEELQCHLPQPFVNRQKAVDLLEKRNSDGDTDQAKIKEIILTLFNLSNLSATFADDEMFQAQANRIYSDLFERAIDLVESNAAAISHFAIYLAKQVDAVPTKCSIDSNTLESSSIIKSIRVETV